MVIVGGGVDVHGCAVLPQMSVVVATLDSVAAACRFKRVEMGGRFGNLASMHRGLREVGEI